MTKQIRFSTTKKASEFYKEVELFQKTYKVECYLLKLASYKDHGCVDETDMYDLNDRNTVVQQLVEYVADPGFPRDRRPLSYNDRRFTTLKCAVNEAVRQYDEWDDDTDIEDVAAGTIDRRLEDFYSVLTDGAEEPTYADLIRWYELFSGVDEGPMETLENQMEGEDVYIPDDPDMDTVLGMGIIKHMEKVFKETKIPRTEVTSTLERIASDAINYSYDDDHEDMEMRLDDTHDRIISLTLKMKE